MTRFNAGIKSKFTRYFYSNLLDRFLDHIGLVGTTGQKANQFLIRAKCDPQWAEDEILKYSEHEKRRAEAGQISMCTIRNFIKPIRHLCKVNKVDLSWDLLHQMIPHGRERANDRAPRKEEIQKILAYPDRTRRIRPVVLVMSSSGIRLDAWTYLKRKHITPCERDGKIVAAHMIVYGGEPEEYQTFMSAEAYHAVKEYLDYRTASGENVKDDSPIIRTDFDKTNPKHNIRSPKSAERETVRKLLERAVTAAGLRPKLSGGVRRYEFKLSHGFKKYFYTTLDKSGKISGNHISMLAGHNTGLYHNYSKRELDDILNEYLQVVDDLVIEKDVRDEHTKKIERLEEDKSIKDIQIDSLKMTISNLEMKLLERDKEKREVIEPIVNQVNTIRDELAILKQNNAQFQKMMGLMNVLEEAVNIAKDVKELSNTP